MLITPNSSHLLAAHKLLGRALHAIHIVLLFIFYFFTFTPISSIAKKTCINFYNRVKMLVIKYYILAHQSFLVLHCFH